MLLYNPVLQGLAADNHFIPSDVFQGANVASFSGNVAERNRQRAAG